jgi:hypothetical protein
MKIKYCDNSNISYRLNSFFTYLLYAFVSIINPSAADKAMFDILKEQFDKRDKQYEV